MGSTITRHGVRLQSRTALPRLAALGTTLLLCACGGGSGSDPAHLDGKAQAGSAAVLEFTTPAAHSVLDAGSPIDVTVQLTAEGAGTTVAFASPAGQWSLATAPALGGVAQTQFTAAASALGAVTITATATATSAPDAPASATRALFVRPSPAPLEVLVPAYFYPSTGSPWTALASGTAAHPDVAVTAIFNPNNGVFKKANPEFTAAAQGFVQAGGRLVGYVYTRYGKRSLSTVKVNIDNYLALYGRGLISGIFIDEMSSAPKQLAYYQQLHDYIRSRDASLRIIGNPGMVPDAGYSAVADVLVTFEGQHAAYPAYDPRTAHAWLYTRSNTAQSALVHNAATCAAMQDAVTRAASAVYNAGPVFVTDQEFDFATGVGNPWADLPAYWPALLGTVAAVNRGDPMPVC